MDSLTQIVLGAACGELVMGKKAGNKAMLFGAIGGTIPDLDILLTLIYPDDLSQIQLHRAYSHALFTHVFLAFPLAWLCYKAFKKKYSFKDWYSLYFFSLTTHAILDAFTTYGTRLFLPFTDYLVGFNNISVIDPAYTLPFMGILIYCLFLKRTDPRRLKWAKRAVFISSAYMIATFFIKGYVHMYFSTQLKRSGFSYNTLKTSPTFFNNALWAGMAINDSNIVMGEYSIFEGKSNIDFVVYPRHLELEKGYESKELNTLKWFSQGAYLLERKDSQTLNFYVVKWGRMSFTETEISKSFVFHYVLRKEGNTVNMHAYKPNFGKKEFSQAFKDLFARIWAKPSKV